MIKYIKLNDHKYLNPLTCEYVIPSEADSFIEDNSFDPDRLMDIVTELKQLNLEPYQMPRLIENYTLHEGFKHQFYLLRQFYHLKPNLHITFNMGQVFGDLVILNEVDSNTFAVYIARKQAVDIVKLIYKPLSWHSIMLNVLTCDEYDHDLPAQKYADCKYVVKEKELNQTYTDDFKTVSKKQIQDAANYLYDYKQKERLKNCISANCFDEKELEKEFQNFQKNDAELKQRDWDKTYFEQLLQYVGNELFKISTMA